MINNNTQYERLSFLQLLKKTNVEIPIIQRDYAQGRENEEKVRNKFLKALYKAFDEQVELDFVYGSEEKEVLQPLDGQQRLTTLFLLHWYISVKENKIDDYRTYICDENTDKIKFSYEIRSSSREFCSALINNSINADIKNLDCISKIVKNSAWFASSWEQDPSIMAMLIMLDAIHNQFKGTNNLWEQLIKIENSPITFLYLKLEDFGLSDDLYIKMNARGKQLTNFENFKSIFEKHIENKRFEENTINIEDNFSHKIDTVWTDLFWQYRETNRDGSYNIDTKLINFIAGIAIYCHSQKTNKNKEKRIQELANNTTTVEAQDFENKDDFQYLVDCLNIYSEKKNDNYENAQIKPFLDLWTYCNENRTVFEDFITYSAPQYKPRVLFYAQTSYLLNNNRIDNNKFSDWMRIVRNIVENSTIDSPETFISAINLIKELSIGNNNIYKYLKENKTVKSGHAKEQVQEEITKACLIVDSPNNKQVVQETEDTNFCRGKINFALYCIDYDKKNIDSFESVKLERIRCLFIKHLDENDISNNFRRALLTIKDNRFYDYWTTSWLYAVDSPKRCFIKNIDDLKRNFTILNSWGIDYMKLLIIKLQEKTIHEIIDDFINTDEFNELPNWKKRIIKEEGLLNYSYLHYITIAQDNSCCWLMPRSKVENSEEGRKKLKKIQ